MSQYLKYNHWYVDDDKFGINFTNKTVEVTPCSYSVKLHVKMQSGEELTLKFKCYEDAIGFTEHVVADEDSIDEIQAEYDSINENKPKRLVNEKPKKDKFKN